MARVGYVNEIAVREAQDQDLSSLKAFYEQHFRPDHPLLDSTIYSWLFDKRGENSAHGSILLAQKDGAIIGHVGVLPVNIRAQGMLLSGAWYFNLMVLPAYTGGGVASRLVDVGLNRFEVLMGLGTTDQGMNLYRRNQYRILGSLVRHIRVLSFSDVSLLLSSPSPSTIWLLREAESVTAYDSPWLLNEIVVDETLKFDLPPDYEEFWHRFSQRSLAAIERSRSYMNWRYRDHPSFRHRLILARSRSQRLFGVLVFRVDFITISHAVPIIRILELMAEHKAIVPLLLWLERFARRLGAAMIEFFSSSSNLFDNSFHRAGYLSSPHPLTIEIPRLYHPPRPASPASVYFSYKLSDEIARIPLGSLYTKEGWYVTLGDSDLDRIQR